MTRVVEAARIGAVSLIDDGSGICNAVYVDDVCDAIYAALQSERAIGQAMFINGDHAVSWKDYNLTFANMVTPPLRSKISRRARSRRTGTRSGLRSVTMPVPSCVSWPTRISMTSSRPCRSSSPPSGEKHGQHEEAAFREQPFSSQASRRRRRRARTGPSLAGYGADRARGFSPRILEALAKRMMDWKPAFDFAAGASVTRTWLEFAGMLQRAA